MRKVTSLLVLLTFFVSCILPPTGFAQLFPTTQNLPEPGTMIALSPAYNPASLMGMVIDPTNPLKFEFLIDKGQQALSSDDKKSEYNKLVKYFLAALTIPDKDQWVNLSPYERDGIIDDNFGSTEMGRDLLAQDYILKQLTASIIHPDSETGKQFWSKIYQKAYEMFGTTVIPVNTFNKVWILPDEAVVYEKDNAAYVLKSHMKVMTERDYMTMRANTGNETIGTDKQSTEDIDKIAKFSDQVVREVLLPAIEKEVNEGKNFANLRQIYSAMVLATWYKKALKESLLGQVYANNGKVAGVDQDSENNDEIYNQYVEAFREGVFNLVKKDFDNYSNGVIARKYFSGGFTKGAVIPVGPTTFAAVDNLKGVGPEVVKALSDSGFLKNGGLPVRFNGLGDKDKFQQEHPEFSKAQVNAIEEKLFETKKTSSTTALSGEVHVKKTGELAESDIAQAQQKVQAAANGAFDSATIELKAPDRAQSVPAKLLEKAMQGIAAPETASPFKALQASVLWSSLSLQQQKELSQPTREAVQRIPQSVRDQKIVLTDKERLQVSKILGDLNQTFENKPVGAVIFQAFAGRPVDGETMNAMRRMRDTIGKKGYDRTDVRQIEVILAEAAGVEMQILAPVSGRLGADQQKLAVQMRLIQGMVSQKNISILGGDMLSLGESFAKLGTEMPSDIQTMLNNGQAPVAGIFATKAQKIVANTANVTDVTALQTAVQSSELTQSLESLDLNSLLLARQEVSSAVGELYKSPTAPTVNAQVVLIEALSNIDQKIFKKVADMKEAAESALARAHLTNMPVEAKATTPAPVHPIGRENTPAARVAQVLAAQTEQVAVPWNKDYGTNKEKAFFDIVARSSDDVRAYVAKLSSQQVAAIVNSFEIKQEVVGSETVVKLVALDAKGAPASRIQQTALFAGIVDQHVTRIAETGLGKMEWKRSFETNPAEARKVLEDAVLQKIGGAAADRYIAKAVADQFVLIPQEINGKLVAVAAPTGVGRMAKGYREYYEALGKEGNVSSDVRRALAEIASNLGDMDRAIRLSTNKDGDISIESGYIAAETGITFAPRASAVADKLIAAAMRIPGVPKGEKQDVRNLALAVLYSGGMDNITEASNRVAALYREAAAIPGLDKSKLGEFVVGASLMQGSGKVKAFQELMLATGETNQGIQIAKAATIAALTGGVAPINVAKTETLNNKAVTVVSEKVTTDHLKAVEVALSGYEVNQVTSSGSIGKDKILIDKEKGVVVMPEGVTLGDLAKLKVEEKPLGEISAAPINVAKTETLNNKAVTVVSEKVTTDQLKAVEVALSGYEVNQVTSSGSIGKDKILIDKEKGVVVMPEGVTLGDLAKLKVEEKPLGEISAAPINVAKTETLNNKAVTVVSEKVTTDHLKAVEVALSGYEVNQVTSSGSIGKDKILIDKEKGVVVMPEGVTLGDLAKLKVEEKPLGEITTGLLAHTLDAVNARIASTMWNDEGVTTVDEAARIVADRMRLEKRNTFLQRAGVDRSDVQRTAAVMAPLLGIEKIELPTGMSLPQRQEVLRKAAIQAVLANPRVRYLIAAAGEAATPEAKKAVTQEIGALASLSKEEMAGTPEETMEVAVGAIVNEIVATHDIEEVTVNGVTNHALVPKERYASQTGGVPFNTPEASAVERVGRILSSAPKLDTWYQLSRDNPDVLRAFAATLMERGSETLTSQGTDKLVGSATTQIVASSVAKRFFELPEGVELQVPIQPISRPEMIKLGENLKEKVSAVDFVGALLAYNVARTRSAGTGQQVEVENVLREAHIPVTTELVEAVEIFARQESGQQEPGKASEFARTVFGILNEEKPLEVGMTLQLVINREVAPKLEVPKVTVVEKEGNLVKVELVTRSGTPVAGWISASDFAKKANALQRAAVDMHSVNKDESSQAANKLEAGIKDLQGRLSLISERPTEITRDIAVRALETGSISGFINIVKAISPEDNVVTFDRQTMSMPENINIVDVNGQKVSLSLPEIQQQGAALLVVRSPNEKINPTVAVYVTSTDRREKVFKQMIEASENVTEAVARIENDLNLPAQVLGTEAAQSAVQAAGTILFVRQDKTVVTMSSQDMIKMMVTPGVTPPKIIAFSAIDKMDNGLTLPSNDKVLVALDSNSDFTMGIRVAAQKKPMVTIDRLAAAQQSLMPWFNDLKGMPEQEFSDAVKKGIPVAVNVFNSRGAEVLLKEVTKAPINGIKFDVTKGPDGSLQLVSFSDVPADRTKAIVTTLLEGIEKVNLQQVSGKRGGIDFDIDQLIMQIKRDENGVPLPLPMQNIEGLGNINGFAPEIMSIQPVSGLPALSEAVSDKH